MELKEKIQNLDNSKEYQSVNSPGTRRVNYESVETVVDTTTGEMSQEKTSKSIRVAKEPPFVKLYIGDLILLKDLPTKSSAVLYELIRYTGFNNRIVLNSSVKKTICEKTGVKMSTLNNTLSSFSKKDILIRIDTGIYMPNPYLFARGNWEEIEQLRILVDYNSKAGRDIAVEINGEILSPTAEELQYLNRDDSKCDE